MEAFGRRRAAQRGRFGAGPLFLPPRRWFHFAEIVLTGYFQPEAHLAQRKPASPVKLYSSGYLQDFKNDLGIQHIDGNLLHTPTFINYSGKAIFSNMILSSFADTYSPRAEPSYAATIKDLYEQKKLSIADVQMMNDRLCN